MRKTLSWDEQTTARENAAKHLPRLLKRYFKEGRSVAGQSPSPERLHLFRLSTKHVRYTLESFQAVYDSSFRDLIALLKDTQDYLGKISDANTTAQWLAEHLKGEDPGMQTLVKRLRADALQKSRKFSQFWQSHVETPGSTRRWEEYLKQPAVQTDERDAVGNKGETA